ncbi:MAG: DUF2384 domain-containing protein [Acidobacteria bacterium]|nr:DUF2384 domain-containing protein [Acidobacteriota bacterium]
MTSQAEKAAVLESYAAPADLPLTETGRVAALLGIEGEALSDVQLADRVGRGLPPEAASVLVDVLGRKNVVGPVIPEATLRRARNAGKPLSREMSERLYELVRVIDVLSRAYHGEREGIEAFLTNRHPLLENRTPLEVACSGAAGARAVLKLIRRAQAGIPV